MIRWFLVAAAVLKGVDALTFDPSLGLAWFAAAAAVAVSERYGCVLLAVVCFGGAGLGLERMTNHVVLLGWVALILAFWTDDRTRRELVRVQLVVLYAFAALSKLNPAFLSGDVISDRRDWLPFPQALAFTAIVVETGMVLLLWRRSRLVLPAAVMLHAGLVVGWTTDFVGHGPGILIFNVMAVALVAYGTATTSITTLPSWAKPPSDVVIVPETLPMMVNVPDEVAAPSL